MAKPVTTVACDGCGKSGVLVPRHSTYSNDKATLLYPEGWVSVKVGEYWSYVCDWDCVMVAASEAVNRGKAAEQEAVARYRMARVMRAVEILQVVLAIPIGIALIAWGWRMAETTHLSTLSFILGFLMIICSTTASIVVGVNGPTPVPRPKLRGYRPEIVAPKIQDPT